MLETWSYSRFATYTQCPQKAKYLYIDRFKEAPSEALENGTKVHNKMEEYLTLGDMEIPEEAGKFKKELKDLKDIGATAECMWAFDKEFKPCGPWDKEVWLRGKLDAYYLFEDDKACRIIDFKTGKVRPKNMEQLDLYALMGFKMFPQVEAILTELWYLDSGTLQTELYKRDQAAKLEHTWRNRVGPYFMDTRFSPKPSMLCGWCSFSKGKGGPCQF